MENIEEIRYEIVKAMLERFPELKEKVREYLESEQSVGQDEELVELLREQGYSERVISNVPKIYRC